MRSLAGLHGGGKREQSISFLFCFDDLSGSGLGSSVTSALTGQSYDFPVLTQ
jgi:hypothetical protein